MEDGPPYTATITWEGESPDNTTGGYFIMKRGKRYVEAAKAIDRATLYDTADAIALLRSLLLLNLMKQSRLI